MDTGTAYGRPAPSYRRDLTEVGPGTPMGEPLRRYWHPVGLASDAGPVPKKVRAGRGPDPVSRRRRPCGAALSALRAPGHDPYYGRVEERGIRCCYHDWLWDVEGRCLEQSCEPGGGARRERLRQPWYPVEERYGLDFAYLGPPEKKPVLPRYDCLEELATGEFIEADDSSIGSGGPRIVPCNWLQHWENVVDPFHVPVLHGSFSGAQFVPEMAARPEVRFETTPRGVKVTSLRRREDGRVHRRVTEAVMPTLRVVPNPRLANEEEHQRYPGDYEAQTGQGPITLHSEEHLATSDKGIALLRRFLEAQLRTVAQGGDPACVAFDQAQALIRVEAGQTLLDSATAA